ncbi:formate/nitrite transporter family protein [Amycolatopsis sp. NPDC059027]|uniref:formate/nitrite transporter family protein n=1 Tax=unclassified Amycolatopsis TaxID=2618356 RepID=UPI00366A66B7
MPLPLPDALAEQARTAESKFLEFRRPGRYLLSSALAGAYIGIAVVLLLAVTGPLNAAGSPWTKLVQGLVFGIALTAVLFAGAELSTGNMMTMVQGAIARRGGVGAAIAVILGSFVGNLAGSVVFAWLVHESGVLQAGGTPGHTAPAAALLAATLKTKIAETSGMLFFRGVLCNFLVCLAVWMAARTRSDGAKLALVFWCLLAFIGSGFEHVVANMTLFSLGLFGDVPGVTFGAFEHNLLWVGLGNLVGGGLLVGAAYGFLGRTPAKAPVLRESSEHREPEPVA